jgi:hypothetical protein
MIPPIMIGRCGQILAPAPLGPKDLVIAGGRIAAIAEPGVEIGGVAVETLDSTTTSTFWGAAVGSASPAGRRSSRPAS